MFNIKLSLKLKIIFFNSILIFLISTSFITSIWSLQQIQLSKEQAVIAIKIHNSFEELRLLFELCLMGPHDYLIHWNMDEKKIFLADYENILIKKSELKSLLLNQEKSNLSRSKEILELARDQLIIIERKLPLLKNTLLNIFIFNSAMNDQTIGSYMEKADSFIREIEAELEKESKVLQELSNNAMNRIHEIHIRILMILALLGIIAILFGIIISYLLIKSITKPIDNLIQATRKIKDGDLAIRAKIDTKDEIGELAHSFNTMIEELTDNQERTSAILHGSGDGICLIDKNFNILQINKQMEKLFGPLIKYDNQIKCHDYFQGLNCHTDKCALKLILKGNKRVEVETLKKNKDGRKVAVEVITTPLKRKEEIIGVIESIHDITKRKIAEEEALRRSALVKIEREKLLHVISGLPGLVFILSHDYSISFANRKFHKHFGDPKGKKCYELLKGYKGPCEECSLHPIFKEKKPKKHQLTSSKGLTFEMSGNMFTDIDESQKVLVLGIDITDHIRTEKAKKDAEQKLEEQRARAILSDRLRSLGEMATGMAHELYQPLVGIRGLAEFILLGSDRGWDISDQILLEKIRLIIDQTDRMTHIIEHIRKFARGANDCELLPVKINEVIESGMNFIMAQMNDKGFVIDYEFADDLPTVLANPFSLEEVILNLMTNARDGSEEKMKTDAIHDAIKIKVRTSEQKNNLKDSVKIEVIDYGAGIPQEYIHKVFDPFFTTKDPDKGTGLGLAISRSIIEDFHGSLDIYSTVGFGTTVTITLPSIRQYIKEAM